MMDRCNKVNKVFSGPSLWFSPCLVSLKGSLSSARSVLLTYAWIRLSSLANTGQTTCPGVLRSVGVARREPVSPFTV
ncbi:unnamed protein product [Boreogadus saida]